MGFQEYNLWLWQNKIDISSFLIKPNLGFRGSEFLISKIQPHQLGYHLVISEWQLLEFQGAFELRMLGIVAQDTWQAKDKAAMAEITASAIGCSVLHAHFHLHQ